MRQWSERDWLIWAGWIGTYAIGWVWSLLLFFARGMFQADTLVPSTAPSPDDILGFALSLGLAWSGIASIQWLLLRQYRCQSWHWIWLSALGWSLFWILPQLSPSGISAWAWLLSGLSVSAAQWFALRRSLVQPGWSVLIYIGALIATGLICLGMGQLVDSVATMPGERILSMLILPGLIYGGLIGFALITLAHRAASLQYRARP
jgi:hypothetical protein